MLKITVFQLGPVVTNCYLLETPGSDEAVVIDPAWDGHLILAEAEKHGKRIGQLWYTHAHFDHIGGAAEIAARMKPEPQVALHRFDQPLWQLGGGAGFFGFHIACGPPPSIDLSEKSIMKVGDMVFEIRHAPGHTPGHCIFYCPQAQVLFSGDLIFSGSVGRTDLPGGDWDLLEKSIREQVFTLPAETRILSGHGEETTVGHEKRMNLFVRDETDKKNG